MTPILPYPFVLAPMAELTTVALRETIKGFSGNVLLCSEMLSGAAIASGSPYNDAWTLRGPLDDPLVYQIAGCEPDAMGEAAARLSARGCHAVDINMGCSAPDILKKGWGAALLRDAAKAREVVRATRKRCSTLLSVKMRAGFERIDQAFIEEFIRMLAGEGVDFVTLHPRTAKMGFAKSADWSLVSRLRERIPIPLIGNGDIDGPAAALRRLRESGCDAVMIGRAAVREPWIFSRCADLMAGKQPDPVDLPGVAARILSLIRDRLPVELHKSRGHRFCFYYAKNAFFGHELFKKIRACEKIDDMIAVFNDYYTRNPAERFRE